MWIVFFSYLTSYNLKLLMKQIIPKNYSTENFIHFPSHVNSWAFFPENLKSVCWESHPGSFPEKPVIDLPCLVLPLVSTGGETISQNIYVSIKPLYSCINTFNVFIHTHRYRYTYVHIFICLNKSIYIKYICIPFYSSKFG